MVKHVNTAHGRRVIIRRSKVLRYAGALKDVPDEEIEEVLREIEEEGTA